MARLIVSPQAQADSDQIIRYLAANAGFSVAARYATAFASLFRRLATFPQAGSPRPEIGGDVRICVVSPYVVLYACDAAAVEAVTVLRIVHGRRRITGSLLTTDSSTP